MYREWSREWDGMEARDGKRGPVSVCVCVCVCVKAYAGGERKKKLLEPD